MRLFFKFHNREKYKAFHIRHQCNRREECWQRHGFVSDADPNLRQSPQSPDLSVKRSIAQFIDLQILSEKNVCVAEGQIAHITLPKSHGNSDMGKGLTERNLPEKCRFSETSCFLRLSQSEQEVEGIQGCQEDTCYGVQQGPEQAAHVDHCSE